jgi:YD repeat-containing protein
MTNALDAERHCTKDGNAFRYSRRSAGSVRPGYGGRWRHSSDGAIGRDDARCAAGGTDTYDSSGNITAIGADTYVYDVENRLTTSVTRGVTETYTYDAFGNRKSATGATNCLGQTICAQPLTVSNTTNWLLTINGAIVHYDTPGTSRTSTPLPAHRLIWSDLSTSE